MNFVKDFVAPISVLAIICLVVSGVLASVYGVTKPIIDARKAKEAEEARVEVLTEADGFTQLNPEGMSENITELYEATNGAGYAITAKAKGYGGDVIVMFGIKSDSTIEKIKVLTHTETPGLGTKVVEEPSYLEQYNGKDLNLEGIDSVSGATVSSNAVMSAARSAFEIYGEVAGIAAPVRPPVDTAVLSEVFSGAEFIRLEAEGEVYKAGDAGYVYVGANAGFAGDLVLAVGLDNNGAVAKIVVAEISETPGYGMKLAEQSYLDGYVGKTKGEELDTVAGSTITSDAFNKTVNEALDGFETFKDAPEMTDAPVAEIVPQEEAAGVDPAVLDGIFAGAEFTRVEGEGELYKAGDMGYVYVGANRGFVGDIKLAIGIDNDGLITKITVVEISETPGYGMQLAEESYLSGYIGKGYGDELDTVAGSTISSDSFNTTVTEAFNSFNTATGISVPAVEVMAEVDTSTFSEIFAGEELTKVDGDAEIYKAGEAGYVYVGTSGGFVGDIKLAVGIDSTGAIVQVVVLENIETDGFGSKLKEESFLSGYVGKFQGQELDTVAGSTVTSDAYSKIIDDAFTNVFNIVSSMEPSGSASEELVADTSMFSEIFAGEELTKVDGAAELYKAGDVGYVYVGTSGGFVGDIKLAVGIDMSGAIVQVVVLENIETDGFGSKLKEESFLSGYVGKVQGDELDTVAGSTVTSDAYSKIIDDAFAALVA